MFIPFARGKVLHRARHTVLGHTTSVRALCCLQRWHGGAAVLRCLALALILLMSPALAANPSLQRLQQFIDDLQTLQANFEQTLYGSDGEPLSTSSGSLMLKRPGRFVWNYTEPEPQKIVADGERIWLYDEDLQQVTVNAIDERISGSPLQLLMQAGDLSESFELTPLGESDGIDWIELIPGDESSDFELIYIGLSTGDVSGNENAEERGQSELIAMELRDNFGQATQIRFSDYQAGMTLDDSLFEFVPPDGVDVIGLDEQ